jgi:hypothetical protein
MSVEHRRAHNRWKWIALGPVLALGVAAMAVGCWAAVGNTRWESRRARLQMLQTDLRLWAERNGHYPNDIGQVDRERGGDPVSVVERAKPETLEYLAAGKPYDPSGKTLLFYEKRPRRYGFRHGRFIARQGIEFVPSGVASEVPW